MLRKIVFVLIALALPLVAAQAASADQYPPTGEGSTVPVKHEPAVRAKPASAPLARTGSSDVVLLGGVALVLVAGGAVVVVASRRRATVSA